MLLCTNFIAALPLWVLHCYPILAPHIRTLIVITARGSGILFLVEHSELNFRGFVIPNTFEYSFPFSFSSSFLSDKPGLQLMDQIVAGLRHF